MKKLSTHAIFVMNVLLACIFFLVIPHKNFAASTPMAGAGLPNATEAGFQLPKNPIVVLTTSHGDIEILLFPTAAPLTCENFLRLVQAGYYNDTVFHRIVKDFCVQGGDPTGTGSGGQSIWGTAFNDEFNPDYKFDMPGRVGMANKGPNTNGSQFFITMVPTPHLNNKHTVFGQVIKGYNVVKKLESEGSQAGWIFSSKPRIQIAFTRE